MIHNFKIWYGSLFENGALFSGAQQVRDSWYSSQQNNTFPCLNKLKKRAFNNFMIHYIIHCTEWFKSYFVNKFQLQYISRQVYCCAFFVNSEIQWLLKLEILKLEILKLKSYMVNYLIKNMIVTDMKIDFKPARGVITQQFCM